MNEYRVLVAPVEQAIQELQHARGMLRARAESEIHAICPALAALSESIEDLDTRSASGNRSAGVLTGKPSLASNILAGGGTGKVLAANSSVGTPEPVAQLAAEEKVSYTDAAKPNNIPIIIAAVAALGDRSLECHAAEE